MTGRLVWRRVTAAPAVPAALLAVLLLVALLLSLTVLAGRSVLAAAVSRTIAEAGPADRAVQVAVRLDQQDPTRQDTLVRGHLSGALAGTGARLWTVQRGELLELTRGGRAGLRLVPWASPGLADRARLSAGRWPVAGAAVLEATVQADAAARAGIRVGSRLAFAPTGAGQPAPPSVQVVGLWRASDPTDPAWFGSPVELTGVERADVLGPLAVDPTELGRLPVTWSARWRAAPQPDRVQPAALAALAGRVAALPDRLKEVPTAGAAAASADGGLARLLGDQSARRGRMLGAVAVLLSVLAALAAAAVVLAAAVLADLRAEDDLVLRSRGARLRQRLRMALLEPLALSLPATVLATPVALLVDRRVLAGPQAPADATFAASTGLAVAVLAGAALVGALLAGLGVQLSLRRGRSAASGHRSPAEAEQGAPDRGGPDRSGRGQLGSSLAVAAAVLLAGWQLARADRTAAGASTGTGGGVDPVLLIAPAALVAGLGVLGVRAVRLVTGPLRWLARLRPAGPALLGWRVTRAAARPAAPLVALLAAVSAAVCTLAAAHDIRVDLRGQALLQLGADQVARAPLAPGSAGPPASAGAEVRRRLVALPGVAAVTPVVRVAGTAGGRPVELLAVRAADLAEVNAQARDRPDLADLTGGVGELTPRQLAPLATSGRQRSGIPLPAGSRALDLTGLARLQVFDRSVPTAPISLELRAVLAGPDGVPVGQPLGRVPVDGSRHPLRVELPAPTGADTRLVGIDAVVPPVGGVGLLSVQLNGIGAVGGAGRTPLPAPAGWGLLDPGLPGVVSAVANASTTTSTRSGSGSDGRPGASVAVDLIISPVGATGSGLRIAPDPAPRPVLPALLERDLARALDLSVGDRISVDRLDRRTDLRVAGLVDALPGRGTVPVAGQQAGGILVDLAGLSGVDGEQPGGSPALRAPREWWVAGPVDPAALASALEPLRENGSGPAAVSTLTAEIAGRLADPWAAGLLRLVGLLPGLLLAAVLVTLALGSAAAVRGRRFELAGLRAVGVSRGQLGRLVAAEQLVLGTATVLLGVLLGVLVARLVVPLLSAPMAAESLSRNGSGATGGAARGAGPGGWAVPADLLLVTAVGLGLVALSAVLQGWAAARVDAPRVLREGAR